MKIKLCCASISLESFKISTKYSITKKLLIVLTLIITMTNFVKSQNQNNQLKTNIGEQILNIHVIPHSHDDAGWLRTFSEYYDGSKGMGCVRCVLDTMLISLTENQNRTFTYAEISFFEQWYNGLNEAEKIKIKFLVEQNRLEFLNGGWVMNDEATTHYQHVIDQMRLGMIFLKREFNYVPKTAWFLDPFGHSASNAYLMQKLNFENLVMVRIDFRDKKKRINNKELEFIWKPFDQVSKGKSAIFTHITYGHYSPDDGIFPGFFERYALDSWRIKSLMKKIYNHFLEIAKAYRTNEIMFLYGDDFVFSSKAPFQNIEKLMQFFSEHEDYKDKINMVYSTPARYFNAVKKKIYKEKIEMPQYVDKDFLPYADKPREYWTGYFTSRPYLKGLIKDAGNYLAQTSQLIFNFLLRNNKGIFFDYSKEDINYNSNGINKGDYNKTNKSPEQVINEDKLHKSNNFLKNNIDSETKDNFSEIKKINKIDGDKDFKNDLINENFVKNFITKLDEMRRELAIAQHHDSVTGTARDIVSDDYINRLDKGMASLTDIVKALLVEENELSTKENINNLTICYDSAAYISCVDKIFGEEEIKKGILLTTINPGYEGKYPKKLKVMLNLNSEFLQNSNKKISLKNLSINHNSEINQKNNSGNLHEELEYDLFFDDKSNYYYIYYVLDFSQDLVYHNILLKFAEANQESEKIQNKLSKPGHLALYTTDSKRYKINEHIEFFLSNNEISFIEKIKTNKKTFTTQNSNSGKNFNFNIKNKNNTYNFNAEEEDIEYSFSLSHAYFDFNLSGRNRQGAYLMATNLERPEKYSFKTDKSTIINGRFLTQINLRFEFSSLIVRIYNPTVFSNKINTYEIETILHQYQPKNSQKEFLLKLNSNINNMSGDDISKELKPEFFTDSNAMRMIKRISNSRETFDLDAEEEKAAGNFYPVNSVIYIQDSFNNDNKNNKIKGNYENKSLFIFNDRSQGASSILQGEILVNINRWSHRDDNRGLADGLNESQSSNRDFSVTHLIALSRNFNYAALSNYVNKKPITAFSFDYNKTEKIIKAKQRNLITKDNKFYNSNVLIKNEKQIILNQSNFLRNLEFKNFNFGNKKNFDFEDLFVIGNKECFEVNYYFVSEKKVLVQFYNKSDPLMFIYDNCIIKILSNPRLNFSKYILNGIEKKKNKFFSKEFLKTRFFVSSENFSDHSLYNNFIVPQQDFETILVEFK